MTFLYEDKTLVKFLSDAGVLDKIMKKAQQAEGQAQEIALKLAQNLLTSNTTIDGKDADVFVKDLVSLQAYLNYLLKNERRTDDGHAIVIQGAGLNGSQPAEKDKALYMPYDGFFVHVGALANKIRTLQVEAEKPGNEVMKPLVKHLAEEASKSFGTAFNIGNEAPPSNPYEEETPGHGRLGFGLDESATDSNSKNVSLKSKDKSTSVEQDLTSIRNALPFQSTASLSPYDMTAFIRSLYVLLHKANEQKLNLNAGPIQGQFEELNSSIVRNYTEWINICNQATTIAPNANTLREEVPYDINGRPFTNLETLFGNTPNAKQAAIKLLQMVTLTLQALQTLQRSPALFSALGKDIVLNQIKQGQAFSNSLGTFSR